MNCFCGRPCLTEADVARRDAVFIRQSSTRYCIVHQPKPDVDELMEKREQERDDILAKQQWETDQ